MNKKSSEFMLSKHVYAYLDDHPTDCNSNKLIREELQAQFPNRVVKSAAVCNATRRWRVRQGVEPPSKSDPESEKARYDERIVTEAAEAIKDYDSKWAEHKTERQVENVLGREEEDAPTELFKKVLRWKRYADQEGVSTRITDIINIMNHTNQLNANKEEVIKDQELIDLVCSQILQFSMSIKKDPEIDDTEWLK